MKQAELQNDLEKLVDQTSIRDVLDNLILVCDEKAQHLRANWQDEISAKAWEKYAKAIASLMLKIKSK